MRGELHAARMPIPDLGLEDFVQSGCEPELERNDLFRIWWGLVLGKYIVLVGNLFRTVMAPWDRCTFGFFLVCVQNDAPCCQDC